MLFFITLDQCLQTCGNEEVLLFQSQFFSRIMIVVRIQYLDDRLRKVLLLNRFVIISSVKRIQLEVCDRFRIPDTQCVHDMISISYDRHIIRDRKYRLKIFLDKFVSSGLRISFKPYFSAETHFFCILVSAQFKRIAIFKPVIRCFHLITVFDLLLEHAVAIPDSASIRRIVQCCQRIQKACRQSSETAVSKSRIRLLVFDHIQIQSQFFQGFFYTVINCQIDQVISKRTPHQKLHGHIINGLRITFLVSFLCCQPVVDDRLFYRVRNSLKQLLLCRLVDRPAVQSLHIFFDHLFECFFIKFFSKLNIALFCHTAISPLFERQDLRLRH